MADTVKNVIKRGRSTVKTAIVHGRATVETAIEHGRATVDSAILHGRATVETAIVHGRATVETAIVHGRATMRAAILHGREDVRIENVPVPKAARGEIIVRVGAALTCGTDLKVFRRGYHARMIVPPALFGHELAGTVVEAGEGVEEFAPGQRVVALNSA
ncbi:MAG: alcohol dehydrogenase catalytic domain-containing protein, partial [Terracidiphilus sp.]